MTKQLPGTTAAKGRVRGLIRILPRLSRAVPDHSIPADSVTPELQKLETARRESIKQIQELLDETNLPPEHREIFESQILLLDDPMLFEATRSRIVKAHKNAAGALAEILEDFKQRLAKSPDALFRERIADLEDIAHRVLSNLLGLAQGDPRLPFLRALGDDAILAADEIPPSLMLHIRKIAGIVTEQGGITGHMAILARDRGIPAVVSIEDLMENIEEGQPAILNADEGILILSPEKADLNAFKETSRKKTGANVKSPVKLKDGTEARIWVNLDDPEDATSDTIRGVHGIGLFRTEFLFYKYPELFDSPDDHSEVYRGILSSLKNRPVTCRLLDVGDDKTLPTSLHRYLDADKQDAEHRGVRFLLAHPGILRLQLKALLRAATQSGVTQKNLRILVPVISTRGEVLAVKRILDECRAEISNELRKTCPDFPLGIMMETPAACVMADVLSRYVDFFSLGTNDLAGFALAFHRSGASEDPIYQPALFRLIHIAMQKATVPVSICGEMANIPDVIPVLLATGIRDFSVSIASLTEVQTALQNYDSSTAHAQLDQILQAQNREEVKQILWTKSEQDH